MIAIGTGLSRWTMPHFAVGIVAFLSSQLLMVTGYAYPEQPLMAPHTFVAVHLITIGWLTSIMLGALYQFVPVITGKPLSSPNLPLVSLIAIGVGLVAMIVGFHTLGDAGLGALPWLPVGGSLVIAGFTLGAALLVVGLCQARPLTLSARFALAGLGFLILTGLFGLAFAFALTMSKPPAGLVDFLSRGLSIHIAAGIGGWFALTAMGVSYRLLSMFMLAPEEEHAAGRWSLRLLVSGLLAFIAVRLLEIYGILPDSLISNIAELPLPVGAALYLVDMVSLYRARRRRELELNSKVAAWSLALLGIGIALASGLEIAGQLGRLAGPVGYLLVFGWLSGLALSQLYKIVPFLTWLERFGSSLGRGPVPRVQDLVNERRASPWFILYFMAVIAGTVAGLLEWTLLWRAAAGLHFMASLLIARELWLARRARPGTLPVRRPTPPRLPTERSDQSSPIGAKEA